MNVLLFILIATAVGLAIWGLAIAVFSRSWWCVLYVYAFMVVVPLGMAWITTR